MFQPRQFGVAAPSQNQHPDPRELRQAMIREYHPAVDRELNEVKGILQGALARLGRLQQANAVAADLQRKAQERDR